MLRSINTNLREYRDVAIVGVIAAFVLAIYGQASNFGFINFDDNFYVYENQKILAGLTADTIKCSFTEFYAGNWHPLTWLSLAADVQVFGPNPGTHHAVNVVLHLVASILAYFAFRRITGQDWPSAFLALLFAVHPAHVESVAWIAERKDVLSAIFWLAAMWSYAAWVKGGAAKWSRLYVLTLTLFALGLMSKPILVTLPAVLLLIDLWPLGRMNGETKNPFSTLLIEKIPFFALSLVSCIVTFAAQRSADAVQSFESFPIATRVENAVVSYAKYVSTAFVPVRLGVWYPYSANISLAELALSIIIVTVITAVAIMQRKVRGYLLVGWLWFIGTLVPVIGLVQVGGQAYADRYTYIPYFGLFIMIAFAAAEMAQRSKVAGRVIFGVGLTMVVAFTWISYIQAGYWRSSETLFVRTLEVTDGNYVIAQNLCAALADQNRAEEAESYCQQALTMRPGYFPALNAIGFIRYSKFDYIGAEGAFRQAISSRPDIAEGYYNLAIVLESQGSEGDAVAAYEKALGLKPEMTIAKERLEKLRRKSK